MSVKHGMVVGLAAGVLVVTMGACGSKSPTTASGGTAANVNVDIVGSSGPTAFSPNPRAVPAGQTLAFRNTTAVAHRIIADNGAWDAGTVAAGATSTVA